MTAAEIKAAIDAGKRVFWSSLLYEVIKDNLGQYLIQYRFGSSENWVGLTHKDGVTLNGDADKFFVKGGAT